jgi:hypothetical protein
MRLQPTAPSPTRWGASRNLSLHKNFREADGRGMMHHREAAALTSTPIRVHEDADQPAGGHCC